MVTNVRVANTKSHLRRLEGGGCIFWTGRGGGAVEVEADVEVEMGSEGVTPTEEGADAAVVWILEVHMK